MLSILNFCVGSISFVQNPYCILILLSSTTDCRQKPQGSQKVNGCSEGGLEIKMRFSRKFLSFFFTLALLSVVFSSPVFSADKLIELPDTHFYINGKAIVLADAPLGLNGRTLLPLRATLVSLGVPDDEEHIHWDGKDKSVTVVAGEKKIVLKLGQKTAYINDAPVAMDVPLTAYIKNNRTYVPIRFIAEAMDKKVAYDGASRTVYIREKESYAAVESILKNVDSAMKAVKRVRSETTMNLVMKQKTSTVSLNVKVREEVDLEAEKLLLVTDMPLLGKNLTTVTYYTDNAVHIKDPLSGTWEKTVLDAKRFDVLLRQDMDLGTVNTPEVLYSALEEQTGGNPAEILLKGNVYPQELASNIYGNAGIQTIQPSGYYFEAILDRETFRVKKLHMEIDGTYTSGSSSTGTSGKSGSSKTPIRSEVKSIIDITYTDYDGDFQVAVPEGLELR